MKKLIPLLTLVLLSACKKNDNNSLNNAAPLLTASGWERVVTVVPVDPNMSVDGGFLAEDLAIVGDSLGLLFTESYDVFKPLGGARGGRIRRGIIALSGRDTMHTNDLSVYVMQSLNGPDYRGHMYFTPGTLRAHVWNSNSVTSSSSSQFKHYNEFDENANVVVPDFGYVWESVFDPLSPYTVAHTVNGSVVFGKSNPLDLGSAHCGTYLNYYNAASKTWLSQTQPYNNGINRLTSYLGNLPLILASAPFATGDAAYRLFAVDTSGHLLILQPNTTNYNFDTLAITFDASIPGARDYEMAGISVSGSTCYALIYSPAKKKIYEFSWTEGSTSVTRVFADAPLDALRSPATPTGRWKHWEVRPDGIPYQLVSNDNNDFELRTLSASGIKVVTTIPAASVKTGYFHLPRYANGYYYAVVYTPPGWQVNGSYTHQLDVVRFKE